MLYDIDYIVIAIVCNMGSTNLKLWNELNVGVNIPSTSKQKIGDIKKECFITHPTDNTLKVFFYADDPHLLKLAQNNFFDHGFRVERLIVNKDCLEEL